MKLITTAPVIIDKGELNHRFINAPTGDYAAFEGHTDLIEYTDGNTGESLYWSAEGDEFYNAKGEKIKNVLKAAGKGIVKGAKAVGRAIVKAERWIVSKSKNLVKGSRKAKKGATVKGNALRHQKTSKDASGKDVFTQELKPATATTPAEKIVTVEGQKFSTVDVPANKPIVISKDPATGVKTVGIEFTPSEVVGVEAADGNINYYPPSAVSEDSTGQEKMSTTKKIVIAVAALAVVGTVVYFIAKKSKK